jgi:hypothetical protein
MSEFHCPEPITVQIKLAGGTADVYAEQRETATVEVEPYGDDDAAREAVERTRVEMRDGTLYVEYPTDTVWPSRNRHQVRVRVWAPAGSTLATNVASADVTCRGPLAGVSANSASGDVSVDEASGDVAVKTASGDVRAGSVGGRLEVQSASADVRASRVGGDARTTSASGDVEIGELGGDLNASTASGDVRVGLAHRGAINVKSASGDVAIGVAAGTLTWLDLNSMSGTTRSDLNMNDAAAPAGPGGEATLSVRVHTMSGDIDVHRVPQPAAA